LIGKLKSEGNAERTSIGLMPVLTSQICVKRIRLYNILGLECPFLGCINDFDVLRDVGVVGRAAGDNRSPIWNLSVGKSRIDYFKLLKVFFKRLFMLLNLDHAID
jgi:hypothetical protein